MKETETQFKGWMVYAALKKNRIKLFDLAKMVGKTAPHLSSRLNANTGLHPNTLKQICRVLGLDYKEVIE